MVLVEKDDVVATSGVKVDRGLESVFIRHSFILQLVKFIGLLVGVKIVDLVLIIQNMSEVLADLESMVG